MKRGRTRSCGCLKSKHGLSHTKAYSCWKGLLRRCYTKDYAKYSDYGGRGITVCKRWKDSVSNFVEDMGQPPEGLSLDRIDNDGNYEPDNCRWATKSIQARNKRSIGTTSKHRGVHFNTKRSLWVAGISVDGVSKHLGYFTEELDAAQAYQDALDLYDLR